jgi:hypothetical protein
MKSIITIEVETDDIPIELLSDYNAVSIEINKNGMSWKPRIIQLDAMIIDGQKKQVKALVIGNKRKAIENSTFNMGLHTGMSMVAEHD